MSRRIQIKALFLPTPEGDRADRGKAGHMRQLGDGHAAMLMIGDHPMPADQSRGGLSLLFGYLGHLGLRARALEHSKDPMVSIYQYVLIHVNPFLCCFFHVFSPLTRRDCEPSTTSTKLKLSRSRWLAILLMSATLAKRTLRRASGLE